MKLCNDRKLKKMLDIKICVNNNKKNKKISNFKYYKWNVP